jgi:ankyrin repeat protein
MSVMRMLLQHKLCVPLLNLQDKEGRTVLLKVAESATDVALPHCTCSERFRTLLDAGADLNIPDNMGCTVLHWAVRRTRVDLVNMILESPEGRRLHDKTAKNTGHTPLQEAVVMGHIQIIRRLMEVKEDLQGEVESDNLGLTGSKEEIQ